MNDDAIKLHEDLLERTIWLNARCDALTTILSSISGDSPEKKKALLGLIDRATNQFYSERIRKIEDTDPAMASRMNRHAKHEEGLSDDVKFLDFP